jgi:hypothetical protein
MIQISDELPSAPLMREMVNILDASGAWFNKKSFIAATENGAGVFSQEHFTDVRSIMRVPIDLMPRLSDFAIDINDDQFGSPVVIGNPTSEQTNFMSMMLDIYNCSNTLASWKLASPHFSLKLFPHVLEHLSGMETKWKNSEINSNKFLADSFFNSRKLGRDNKKNLNQEETTHDKEALLMPMIDVFNHNIRASAFRFSDSSGSGNLRVFSRPDSVSNELFVRYNPMDAVISYLNYGFIDYSAPFLYSAPIHLCYRDFDINIKRSAAPAAKVPLTCKDISLYMPSLVKENNMVFISKLAIPSLNAPNALRRVLAIILSGLNVSRDKLSIEIRFLEKEIIDKNFMYWNKMRELSVSVPRVNQVHQLTDKALTHLETYKQSVMIRDV